jgi:hypothetical protein
MTTPADDFASERAFEALLAGRAVPEEAAGLAAFTGAVRASATQPGRPNAALAELLATGLLTDQSSPSNRTAVAAGPLPSRRARVRRRRFAMIFPALLAKFLSAGALAQAATGATVVVVAVTGAGATGVLGEDVQDGLTSVVAADDETGDPAIATPVDDTATPTDPGVVPTTPAETTAPVTPTETAVDPAAFVAEGPAGYASFGEWVSRCAHDSELRARLRAEGISFGQVVRTWAHKKGMSEQDLAEDGVDLNELTDDDAGSPTAEPTPTAEVAESTGANEDRGGRKGGDDHGGANGNRGGGNGGRGGNGHH